MQQTTKELSRGVVKGLVIPEQWNNAGEVVGITIQTSQEEIFFVAPNKISHELLAHIHREVEASGKIDERINGTTLITVKSYRLIGDVEDQPPTD